MKFLTRTMTLGWALCILGGPADSQAARTEVIRDDDFKALQQGEFEGVALSSDGYLFPTQARRSLGDTGTEIVWAVVDQGERGVLCATGHSGKLIRIDREGKVHELGSAAESELTAMLEMADGSVLIAAAPGGQIYRLGTDDKIEPFAKLDAKFIWSMARDAAGNVWVATGTEGRLYKISSKGSEVEIEGSLKLPSTNLIDLWIDADGLMGKKGWLYIAGERPGYLYAYEGKSERSEVLYDAQSDEIRAIEPTARGLAIATNTERAPSPQALNLTLRMSGAPLRGEGSATGTGPGAGGPKDGPESDMGDVFESSEKKSQNPVSRIVLIRPDGFSELVWTSPERPIHDISATPGGSLLVAAGGRGRVFEVRDDMKFSLLADTQEDYLPRLTPVEGGWLASGARNGAVYRLDAQREARAVYRSRVLGAAAPVRWGKFHWSGTKSDGDQVLVSFRQSNAEDSEEGLWQPWSEDRAIDATHGIDMPATPSRFLQYRLTMTSDVEAGAGPKTDYVEVFYQDENRAPRLRGVNVSEATPAAEAPPGGGAPGGGQNAPPPKAEGGGGEAASQGGGRPAHSNTGTIQVSWAAADPNQDRLQFALYFKGEDEATWKLIDDELEQANLPLQVKGVADGRYRFKVVVTDKLSNPPGVEMSDEMISDEVIVDNTPARIEELGVQVEGDRARLRLRAVDAVSFISAVEIDIDNDDSYPLFPSDGFYDDREERVDWLSGSLKPGEHVLTVAVTDRQGNTAVAKTIFTIATPTP